MLARSTSIALVAVALLSGFHVAEGPGAAVGGVAALALNQLAVAALKALTGLSEWMQADQKFRAEIPAALQGLRAELSGLRDDVRQIRGE